MAFLTAAITVDGLLMALGRQTNNPAFSGHRSPAPTIEGAGHTRGGDTGAGAHTGEVAGHAEEERKGEGLTRDGRGKAERSDAFPLPSRVRPSLPVTRAPTWTLAGHWVMLCARVVV